MPVPGFSIKSAFSKENAGWPPDAVEATSLLPLLSESVSLKSEHEGLLTVDRQSYTKIVQRQSFGDVSLALQYKGLEFYFAAALGFSNPQSPTLLETGAYQHLFEVDHTLSEQGWLAAEGWLAGAGLTAGDKKIRHGTYVVDKGQAPWETNGVMLQDVSFQANPAGCTVTSNVSGYTTSYFSATVFSGLSCTIVPVRFSDMRLLLGASPSLVEVPDVVGTGFTVANNLASVQTVETRTLFAEPRREAPALVSGSFALPFYTSQGPQLQLWADNGTRLYGCIEFVGEQFSATYSYTLRFWFPEIRLTSYDIGVQGPEQLQQVYDFVGNTSTGQPGGFPTILKNGPVLIELINDVSQNPLL